MVPLFIPKQKLLPTVFLTIIVPAIKASLIPFGRSIPTPRNALNQIKGNFIVSCGSLYLQGNLLKILEKDSDEDLSLL